MQAYYYAGGQKIPLEPDDEHVAVDKAAASTVESAGTRIPVPGNIVILERSAVDASALTRLRRDGAVQTVYRRNQALVVPLPEVRIEFDKPSERKAVLEALAASPTPHTIAEDTEDRLVVAPDSGSGDDAIRLANEVYERARPAAASVRFAQVVPKPVQKR